MKRLVALMLIFGLASAANAVILQVDGLPATDVQIAEGATSVITIVGENASSWLGYIIIKDGGSGTLSDVTILPAAGDLAASEPYTEAGWGTGYMLTTATSPGGSPPLGAGSQFNLNYSGGLQGQTATISLFLDPEYITPVASVNVSIIPEPMTIALLAAGCLAAGLALELPPGLFRGYGTLVWTHLALAAVLVIGAKVIHKSWLNITASMKPASTIQR